MLGAYRLLHRLGVGGMGIVWLAEQTQPVHRRVAVKVIKAGMDSRHMIARFEAERQALALMDHSAVAKVFDGGTTPDGRPYFVMEYVKGEPITAYCNQARLTTAQRIALFIRICEGVQHAHQKGIIHRDLKPSNVLVTLEDNHPVPKIIDFGVAKTTMQLTSLTLFTEVGALVGTPEYMSPEQAEMGGLDIDTRTDVYALGAILYELLTGALPFDAKRLREKGIDEIRRTIREIDPPRPSTRVTSLGPDAVDIARHRQTDPDRLAGQLRGDLDWITMKALEKDRTRRYDAVSDLVADLRRHLDDQPVLAGPPSTVYRVRKFVRRHQVGAAAAATILVLLIASVTALAFQARRIARERDRANHEAEAARQVSGFLTGLFETSDPAQARGNTITAREILDKGSAKIDTELATQPEVQARLMTTMGNVYRSLGSYDQAAMMLDRALQIRRRVLGPASAETLTTIRSIAVLRYWQGKYAEGEALHREALEGFRRIRGLDDGDVLESVSGLGADLVKQGKYREAEPYVREALETQRRVFGADALMTLKSMNNLGALLDMQGKPAEAEQVYREAVTAWRRSHSNDPLFAGLLGNFGAVLQRLHKLDEAEAVCREGLETRTRIFGADHPNTLRMRQLIGSLLRDQGKLTEAEQYLRQTLDAQRRVLPPRHRDTAQTLLTLATVLNAQGRFAEAESPAREALEIRQATLPAGDSLVVDALSVLGQSLLGRGEFAQAEPLLVQAYTTGDAEFKHETRDHLVKLYDAWHKPEKAAEWRAKPAEAVNVGR